MSEVKNDLMAILVPFFEKEGFKYRKSKNEFIKIENEISHKIAFQFDGRGGLSMVNNIYYSISVPEVQKAFKKITAYPYLIDILGGSINYWHNYPDKKLTIPVMYSQEALDVANTMNMKALAAIPYEEKYPRARIENCAKKITELYAQIIIPFFEKYTTLEQFYNLFLNENPKKGEPNPLNLDTEYPEEYNKFNMLFIKLLSKKMNLEEPKIIEKFPNFIQELIASNIHLESANLEELKKSIENYQF
jgi:hypothetical protein